MFSKIAFALFCACSTFSVSAPEQVAVRPLQSFTTLPVTTNEVTRIYFIRNGESDFSATDANGTKFTSGKSPKVPLNEQGIEQASRLGKALASKIQDVVVYTAPAARSEQTAALILSKKDRIVMGGTSEGLSEVGMGTWEGKPKDKPYQDEYQKWKNLPASQKYATPKVATGESYKDAASRALVALDVIIKKEPGKTIFIVSGENLLNALAIRWSHPQLSQKSGSDLPMLPMDHCDLFMIEIPSGQSVETADLKMLIHLTRSNKDINVKITSLS